MKLSPSTPQIIHIRRKLFAKVFKTPRWKSFVLGISNFRGFEKVFRHKALHQLFFVFAMQISVTFCSRSYNGQFHFDSWILRLFIKFDKNVYNLRRCRFGCNAASWSFGWQYPFATSSCLHLYGWQWGCGAVYSQWLFVASGWGWSTTDSLLESDSKLWQRFGIDLQWLISGGSTGSWFMIGQWWASSIIFSSPSAEFFKVCDAIVVVGSFPFNSFFSCLIKFLIVNSSLETN